MESTLLAIACRFIVIVLLAMSVVLYLTGHNHTGGGFVAGLVAGIAFVVYFFIRGLAAALQRLRFQPRVWMIAGLLLVLASGLAGPVSGRVFLTGRWLSFHLPLLGEQHLGTPMLFDLGITVMVIGATAAIVANLAEE